MTAIRRPGISTREALPLGGVREADARLGLPRAGGWLSLVLLTLMLLSVAWSVNAAGWTEGLHLLQWMVLGGVLLGLGLSQARWSDVFSAFHAILCSVAWLLFWMSTLLPQELEHRQRVFQLLGAIALWLEQAVSGAVSAGRLIFVLLLAILFWWLAFFASWALFRRQSVWQAIIPAGLAMLVNLYYAPSRLSVYFLLFTFCALLLAVRSHLAQREEDWRSAQVRYALDIGLDFLRDGVIFAILVLALAWLLPGAASQGRLEPLVKPFEEPWERVKAEWNRLFHSLQYPTSPVYAAFGKSLLLSGPVNLGDTVIMDVRAQAGRYWRGVVYHTYTGRGWLNTDQESTPLGAGESLRVPTYELRQEITQTITTFYPGTGLLFATGQPLRVLLPAQAEVNILPDDVLPTPTPLPGGGRRADLSPPLDISMLFSRSRLREGQSYSLVSSISQADVESLRAAGDAYPDWVRERYLQLPEELPQRVRDLAQTITAQYKNPYDKATALERYLREMPYNDKIAPPPPDRDAVDYFLFGVREGYCDYYASAMVTMARAVGIPARLAAGYSRGEYQKESGVYRVRERNAHAWVEVFFPRYGWVEFEPTANEPQIVRAPRPPGADSSGPSRPSDLPPWPGEEKFGEDMYIPTGPVGGASGPGQWWTLNRWWVTLAAALVLLAALGGGVWWTLRRPPAAVPHLLTQLYVRLIRWGERLKLPWQAHQTPYEQARLMAQAVPEGQAQIDRITDLYVRECFSPTPISSDELASAAQAWLVLRPCLWRRWLRRLAQPPEGLIHWRDRWSRRLASQFPG
ncbi:MAG: transglutaminase domain-containing protein [Anaerolineae bacterium]|nr:transglutaminase domain-containing protein [Anaerolineae bacterium]